MKQIVKSTQLLDGDLEKINQFTRRPFKEEEIYTFSVILCDNDIDRDGEAFTVESLQKLSDLYVGKTGIFDHNPKGENQNARIYHTEVKAVPDKYTAYGMPYYQLEGKAYMVRSNRCEDLILEIEAGIKKEVSVGCRIKQRTCSICGNKKENGCVHQPGKYYHGKLCYIALESPEDAYEWSFVAVPSQKEAGVIKQFDSVSEKQIIAGIKSESLKNYITSLKQTARLGETYIQHLRKEVVRLGFLSDCGLDDKIMNQLIQKMNVTELEAFQKAFINKCSQKSIGPQLYHHQRKTEELNHENEEFKI